MTDWSILDLFAGPGGWDEGLRLLGYSDRVLGLEMDKDAVATARAAGFARLQCDIRDVNPHQFRNVVGLIASPPCQTFSAAGHKAGQGDLNKLVEALHAVAEGMPCAKAAGMFDLDLGDPRSTLILEPMRFIRALQPQWIAMEEVPPVLPVWEAYATILSNWAGDNSYSTWAGKLCAADYSVPQARVRSFLLASNRGSATPPKPTHTRHEELTLFDQRTPWITMAEALDLGPRATDDTAWMWDRPATTVVRSFRPDIIAAPGYRTIGDPSRQNAPGSFTATPEQMMTLQGIRTDYPFTATSESKRQSLIGAILPPPWAAAILKPLINLGEH